jgi:hypothetical protein
MVSIISMLRISLVVEIPCEVSGETALRFVGHVNQIINLFYNLASTIKSFTFQP